ncbi:MAG: signal peptidase I [Thaumarchaeota archaeon]|nr:signal peptidase I [Nitrososphaerota archaeon]
MPSHKVKHAIKDVIIVVGGVIAVWLVLQVAFGTSNPFYVVSSGSMKPALGVYDVIIVKNGSTFESVQRGDIIVFDRPKFHDRVIVHRVIDITESDKRFFTTKGDSNSLSIPATDFHITEDDYIGEVVFVIPKIGYVTRLIQPPVNYIIIAIILAILFFNRTSFVRREKHDKELPTAENLPENTEEKKNTVLPETFPNDDIKDRSYLNDAVNHERSEEDGAK